MRRADIPGLISEQHARADKTAGGAMIDHALLLQSRVAAEQVSSLHCTDQQLGQLTALWRCPIACQLRDQLIGRRQRDAGSLHSSQRDVISHFAGRPAGIGHHLNCETAFPQTQRRINGTHIIGDAGDDHLLPSSNLIARQIAKLSRYLYASIDYLDLAGEPTQPDELIHSAKRCDKHRGVKDGSQQKSRYPSLHLFYGIDFSSYCREKSLYIIFVI